jgi:hypothetical protein
MRLAHLAVSVLTAALVLAQGPGPASAGADPAARRNYLRPRLMVSTHVVHAITAAFYLQGDWLVWPESDVASPYDFATYLYNIRTRRQRVVHPALLPRGDWVGDLKMSYPWLLWGQSPDPFTFRDFRICVLNVQSGQTWVLDSARAEGQDPRATPSGDNGAIALDGTTAAWTILQHTGRAVRSVLKVEDLTTRRVRVVASAALRPAGSPESFGHPQLAGPYLAWQRAILMHGRTPTGTIAMMNLATGQRMHLPVPGSSSEPALGSGYLAWKIGPTFRESAGIGVYNLRTGQTLTIRSPGAAGPTLGTCLVAYRFFDNPTSPLADGLYDLCHRQKLELRLAQEMLLNGEGLAKIQLSGNAGIMDAGRPDRVIAPTAAIFRFSPAHPLYDFYH